MRTYNNNWLMRFTWWIIAVIMLIVVVYNLAYAGSSNSSEDKLIHSRPDGWTAKRPDNPLSTPNHSIDPEASVIPVVPLLGGMSLFR